MKRSEKLNTDARLQLLSFTIGNCIYALDRESMNEIRRLEMITVIHHAVKRSDETISPSSKGRTFGRNDRTNA